MFVSFSESGEMCAVKEVTLFSDDPKSMESAKQFMQVNWFLTNLVNFMQVNNSFSLGAIYSFLVLV